MHGQEEPDSSVRPPPPSIDIGANLLDPMFQGIYSEGKVYHQPDLDAVLRRAWEAGLEKIIITAGNLEEAKAALALARTHGKHGNCQVTLSL